MLRMEDPSNSLSDLSAAITLCSFSVGIVAHDHVKGLGSAENGFQRLVDFGQILFL